jgi:hypothetical protein
MDCGPNAGRLCPIAAEQALYNTLEDIRRRGRTALIFQRGLDGITDAPSLHDFLCF